MIKADGRIMAHRYGDSRRNKCCSSFVADQGFTLLELLVSGLILAVAATGAIGAFNLISQSMQGTGIRSEQQRLIDSDIAKISYLAETFTSCEVPAGTNPSSPDVHCDTVEDPDVEFNNSYYYFPYVADGEDRTTWTDANSFATACANGTLRTNFKAALKTLFTSPNNPIPSGVDVARNWVGTGNDPVDLEGSNYLVRISWVDPSLNNRELRSMVIGPVVASWCP